MAQKISLSSMFLCIVCYTAAATLWPAKEGIDIVPLDLQLIEDELAHKVVFRLMDHLLGSGILGDGSPVDDQHPVGEG